MVTVAIAVTKRWCGNGGDALIVTSKYRSKSKDIHWYGIKHGFFLHLYNAEIIVFLFKEPLHRGWYNVMRPCFYTMLGVDLGSFREWAQHIWILIHKLRKSKKLAYIWCVPFLYMLYYIGIKALVLYGCYNYFICMMYFAYRELDYLRMISDHE